MQSVFELLLLDAEALVILKSDQERRIELLTRLIKQAQQARQLPATSDAQLMAANIYGQFPGWRRSYLLHADARLIGQLAATLKNSLRLPGSF